MAAAALAGLFPDGAGYAQTVEEKPLVELGIFGAGGIFPDYPASAQSHFHALPLPYVIYRGEYLQLAPNSVRGLIVNSDRLTLDVSASGAFRSSHDNAARVGMPGLDDMGQVGPQLDILLAHDAVDAKIDVELPVRAVFSTDFKSLAYRGVVTAPEIAYTHANFMNSGGRLKFGFGPEFASARLMDYFYAVAPQFVIPGRPRYNAAGGYLGSRAELSYRYPIGDRATLIALAAPELYAGATNETSPLFKKQYGISAALGFTFSFYGSPARAVGATDADGEPPSSPRPHAAAVRSDDPPPAAVRAADPQPAAAAADERPRIAQSAAISVSAAKRDDDPSALAAGADDTPAAPPPAQQGEARREQDLSGWVDRLFAGADNDPRNRNFVMISGASGDPRAKADQVCARTGLMAVLVTAERSSGANPDEDKIAWHFSCRY